MIRRCAGLSGYALYSADDLKGHDTVLDVVLEERRLELAFEHHRKMDIFRNNRDLVRKYRGYHVGNGYYQLVPKESSWIVHFIPERERLLNPNLINNPQGPKEWPD